MKHSISNSDFKGTKETITSMERNTISVHWVFLKISTVTLLLLLANYKVAVSQSFAPCPPTAGANSIDLSDQFGTGSNTSSSLFAYQTSLTFLDASVTPISDNWWRNDSPPVWYLGAYSGNTTNIQLTAQNYPNPNTGKEIRITGDFIVDRSIAIQYSEIKMNSGARIIIKSGALLDLKTCWVHSCDETTPMWEGIIVESGGFLRTTASALIEDGITAISALNNSFIDISISNFNRNYIGIKLEGPVVNGTAVNTLGYGVNIERTSFSCVDKSMLSSGTVNLSVPYLPSTLNAPYTNKRSNIGISVNGIAQNNMPHIGRTYQSNARNQFVNLVTGIKVFNSFAQVLNGHFYDINADPSITKSVGIAIDIQAKYSVSNPNTTMYKTQIGDDDPLSQYDQCTFDNVFVGVQVTGASDISLYNGAFINWITSPVILDRIRGGRILVKKNTIRNYTSKGLSILNCINNIQLEVHDNDFDLNVNSGYSPSSKFSETGIYMVNTPMANSGATISENTFNNVRVGVYCNGVSTTTITSNVVTYNRPWSVIQNNLHAGFWLDNTDNARIYYNLVEYNATKAVQVPSGSSIAQDLRGLVLKATTNTLVASNVFRNTGRPVRCVDNIMNTYFNCNEFDGSFDAWQFQNVDLSVQGGPTKPTGNIWKNYPRVNSTASNKVAGNLTSLTDYYYSPVTAGAITQIPLPNGCFNFFQQIATGTSPCQDQQLDDGGGDVLDFVLGDTINVSNDSLLTEERRRWTAYLLASDSLRALPDYQNWYQQMEGSESRIYANLVDSAYERSLIVEELQQLSGFKSPAFQYKRDLFLHALVNQLSEEDEDESYDTLQLETLANTPAWSGTSAVFLARAILSEEVDDEDMGLRLLQHPKQENPCSIAATIQHQDLRILSTDAYIVELYTTDGRLMSRTSLTGDKLISLSNYDQIGFYRVYSANCTTTGKWMLVR